jgi:hypothetical protein
MNAMVKIINGKDTYVNQAKETKNYVSILQNGKDLGTQLADLANYNTDINKEIQWEQNLLQNNFDLTKKALQESYDDQINLLMNRRLSLRNNKKLDEDSTKEEINKQIEFIGDEIKIYEQRQLKLADEIEKLKEKNIELDSKLALLDKNLIKVQKSLYINEDNIKKLNEKLLSMEEKREKSKLLIQVKIKENRNRLKDLLNFRNDSDVEEFFESFDKFDGISRKLASNIRQIVGFIDSLKLNYKFFKTRLGSLKKYSHDVYKYALTSECDKYKSIDSKKTIPEVIFSGVNIAGTSDFTLEEVQDIYDRNYHIQIMSVNENARYEKVTEFIDEIKSGGTEQIQKLESSIKKLEKSNSLTMSVIREYEDFLIENASLKIKKFEEALKDETISDEETNKLKEKLENEFKIKAASENKIKQYENSKNKDLEEKAEDKLEENRELLDLTKKTLAIEKKRYRAAFSAIVDYMLKIGLDYKRRDCESNLTNAKNCLFLNSKILENVKAIDSK